MHTQAHTLLKMAFHSPVLYLNILNLIIHVRDHSAVKSVKPAQFLQLQTIPLFVYMYVI